MPLVAGSSSLFRSSTGVVPSAARPLRQAGGKREQGTQGEGDKNMNRESGLLRSARAKEAPGRSIEKLIFNRARPSGLKGLVQNLDPMLDRQRGSAADMHEATYIGSGNPIRMARFECRYFVFQQLLR